MPDTEVVGDPDDRLPHVVTFSSLYVDGEAVVGAFDAAGFAVASGSACTSSTLEPSHVLAAMGVLTHGNVRVTLPLPAVSPALADDVRGLHRRHRADASAPSATSSGSATCDRRRGRRRRTRRALPPPRDPSRPRSSRDRPDLASVTVLATDPAAAHDVPAWCRMRGHRFVEARDGGDHTAYLVEVVRPSTPEGAR